MNGFGLCENAAGHSNSTTFCHLLLQPICWVVVVELSLPCHNAVQSGSEEVLRLVHSAANDAMGSPQAHSGAAAGKC